MSVWDALTTRQIARILLTAAAICGLLYLLVQIRGTLLLLAIAIFLAVALGPAVDYFSKNVPRAAAILIVYVMIFCVFSGVLALVVPPVINGASDLSSDIPNYIQDLRNNDRIAEFDDKYDITPRLQEEAKKLPDKLGDAAGALQSIAAGAFNAAFQLLTILTMTFFLLLDGRRMAAFMVRRFGGENEERLRGVIERIYKSTSGYVAGALTITSINGFLTFVVLTILGVPFAVPLAVLMSFFGLIPLVGATIGGVIILDRHAVHGLPAGDDHLRHLPAALPAAREQRPAAVHLQAHGERPSAGGHRRDPRRLLAAGRRRRARRDPGRRGDPDHAARVPRRGARPRRRPRRSRPAAARAAEAPEGPAAQAQAQARAGLSARRAGPASAR